MAGLNRVSPQASSRRAGLSHFRPPGQFSPQAPLGQVGSVFSVAQVPWGLVRLNNYSLPATFAARGTRSFQPPKYAVDKPGLSHLSPPGILGTGGTQSFKATWSFRLQVPFGLAGLNYFSSPGTLETVGLNRFSPQAFSGRAGLSHFRPPVHFSTQVPLGLAGSVFSVAQVPWGLARLSNSWLPGTFGASTRSF